MLTNSTCKSQVFSDRRNSTTESFESEANPEKAGEKLAHTERHDDPGIERAWRDPDREHGTGENSTAIRTEASGAIGARRPLL